MDLNIAGTNVDMTERVRLYATQKIGKLDRYWANILEIRVEISEEKTKSPDQHVLVRVNVDGPGHTFHGEARAEDQIKAIDRVSEIMVRQLEHYKGKLQDKPRSLGAKAEAAAEALPAALPERRKVVKVKNFLVKPMSLEEAIDQMEVLQHDFFLFLGDDTEEVKLLYRRKDGNYGLIEPKLK